MNAITPPKLTYTAQMVASARTEWSRVNTNNDQYLTLGEIGIELGAPSPLIDFVREVEKVQNEKGDSSYKRKAIDELHANYQREYNLTNSEYEEQGEPLFLDASEMVAIVKPNGGDPNPVDTKITKADAHSS